jgi:hypothetical protein
MAVGLPPIGTPSRTGINRRLCRAPRATLQPHPRPTRPFPISGAVPAKSCRHKGAHGKGLVVRFVERHCARAAGGISANSQIDGPSLRKARALWCCWHRDSLTRYYGPSRSQGTCAGEQYNLKVLALGSLHLPAPLEPIPSGLRGVGSLQF